MDPLHPLDAAGLAAWRAGYAAAVMHGIWDASMASGLQMLGWIVSDYVRSVHAAHTDTPRRPPDDLALLRMETRRMMAAWFLLPEERIPAGRIRSDGLDADIARAAGLPDLE